MKRAAILFVLISFLTESRLHAQSKEARAGSRIGTASDTAAIDSFATITGTLKDEQGNPIIAGYVECSIDGAITGSEVTDLDGNYTIRPLDPGTMTVTFKYQGKELIITDITLIAGTTKTVNATITIPGCNYRAPDTQCVRIVCRQRPLIDPAAPGGTITHSGHMLW